MAFSGVPHFQVKNLLKHFGSLPFADLVMGSRADTISEQLSQEQEVIEVQGSHPVQHCFHKTSHGRAACHQKIYPLNWTHGMFVLSCLGQRSTINIRVGNTERQKRKTPAAQILSLAKDL